MKKLILLFILFLPWITFGYTTKNLTDLGYWTWTAKYIIQQCNKIQWVKLKKWTWDSQHCIKLAAAIGCAESSCWKNNSLNPWWFRNQKFKSQTVAFDRWMKSYKKYWHKLTSTPKDFYGKKNKHHYCVDEVSSKTIGWCPNGLKHSTSAWNKLLKLKPKAAWKK